MVGIIGERAGGNAISTPRAIASKAIGTVEDNRRRELSGVELLLPVSTSVSLLYEGKT